MTSPKHPKTPATTARGEQPEGQLGRELLLGYIRWMCGQGATAADSEEILRLGLVATS